MAIIITGLKIYFVLTVIILLLYMLRHFIFSINRLYGKQRMYYNDIISSDDLKVSVLIPMHNEEKVLHNVLDSLLKCDYDRDKLEIIPINDHSTDKTAEILDEYNAKYPCIKPIHRNSPLRGKPAGLNDAMKIATGDIIIVFDADYRPSSNLIHSLTSAFNDPQVGAVMGRVIPYNSNTNMLTRLLSLERSGGYQVSQQARYNLKLMPQYGGTVGAFKKDIVIETGGFNTLFLAEDTELTYRLYTKGYKVVYANNAECYEESPETWKVRGGQIRRWSRGHNRVMFHYFLPSICSKHMTIREKVDAIFLLLSYTVPVLLALLLVDSLLLFFMGQMNMFVGWWTIWFMATYSCYGNFAIFYELATAQIIDGNKNDILLLPLMTFSFYFYLVNICLGFFEAMLDLFTNREVKWAKTERFASKNKKGVIH